MNCTTFEKPLVEIYQLSNIEKWEDLAPFILQTYCALFNFVLSHIQILTQKLENIKKQPLVVGDIQY